VVQAPVVGSVGYPGFNHLLALRSREIAASAKPGQFVMAGLVDCPSAPLLKRALAVYSIPRPAGDGSILTLLIKVVGLGTRLLAALREGDQVSLIGPLGNGFDTSRAKGRVSVVVAGGVGIASVFLLAKELSEAGEEVHLLYGARRARDLVGLEDFQDLGIQVQVATEDGSRGIRGLVTQILEPYFRRYPAQRLALYTCGPNPMMQAVSRLASTHGVDCQVSVETPMACGFGVCLGCSVRTVHSYRLACTRGPVFDAREVVWDTATDGEGVHA
jgi:dihydroorotate dehydrogenase electron transfer subunit